MKPEAYALLEETKFSWIGVAIAKEDVLLMRLVYRTNILNSSKVD